MKGTVIKCEQKKYSSGGTYYSFGVQTAEGKLYGTADPKKNPAIQNWLLEKRTVLYEAKQDGDWWRFHDMSIIEASPEPPSPEEEAKDLVPIKEVYIARECSAKLTEAFMLRRQELGLSCTPGLLGRLAKFWAEFIQRGDVPYSEDEFEDKELFKMDISELPDLIHSSELADDEQEEVPAKEQKPEKDLSLAETIAQIRRFAKEVGGELQAEANQKLIDGISKSEAWDLVNRLKAAKKAMKVQ